MVVKTTKVECKGTQASHIPGCYPSFEYLQCPDDYIPGTTRLVIRLGSIRVSNLQGSYDILYVFK